MRTNKIFSIMAAVVTLLAASSCDSIDNKAVPQFTVRIDLGGFAMWNTYGVGGMGDYRMSIDPDNLDAVCPKCGSRYNPLTGDGGPVQGVAINNKVGLRKYRVTPLNGGYLISN